MKEMTKSKKNKILILGIGNILMGDEGIGVHVVRALEKVDLPESIKLLDGGTGSFNLLEPMRSAEKIILIDAMIDENEVGTVRLIRPRFSKDYPRTLTAHDIGLKDLLDAFYLLGETPEITLFAVTIPTFHELAIDLSPQMKPVVSKVLEMILEELGNEKNEEITKKRISQTFSIGTT